MTVDELRSDLSPILPVCRLLLGYARRLRLCFAGAEPWRLQLAVSDETVSLHRWVVYDNDTIDQIAVDASHLHHPINCPTGQLNRKLCKVSQLIFDATQFDLFWMSLFHRPNITGPTSTWKGGFASDPLVLESSSCPLVRGPLIPCFGWTCSPCHSIR